MGGIVAMSSTINASTASGGGVITTADASGILQLQTAGTTALTIDASQNVGIGTSSPAYKLDVVGSANTYFGGRIYNTNSGSTAVSYLQIGNDSNGATAQLGLNSSTNTSNFGGANALYLANGLSAPIVFATTNTERMRIDSAGNLLVGTTSSFGAGKIQISNSGNGQLSVRHPSATVGKYWNIGCDNSSNAFVVYNQGNTGCYVPDGGTGWVASSDERLKTELIPIENGLEKVNSLRSVTGRYKTDEEGVSRSFLIAQDVQKVLPEAVSVQDDELGTLGVAYTEVIPLLVASIKELKAIIDTQNARIEALEAK